MTDNAGFAKRLRRINVPDGYLSPDGFDLIQEAADRIEALDEQLADLKDWKRTIEISYGKQGQERDRAVEALQNLYDSVGKCTQDCEADGPHFDALVVLRKIGEGG